MVNHLVEMKIGYTYTVMQSGKYEFDIFVSMLKNENKFYLN